MTCLGMSSGKTPVGGSQRSWDLWRESRPGRRKCPGWSPPWGRHHKASWKRAVWGVPSLWSAGFFLGTQVLSALRRWLVAAHGGLASGGSFANRGLWSAVSWPPPLNRAMSREQVAKLSRAEHWHDLVKTGAHLCTQVSSSVYPYLTRGFNSQA